MASEHGASTDLVSSRGEGLFCEREIIRPMTVALLLAIVVALTAGHFYPSEARPALINRYLDNGFCLLIIFVFIVAMGYAALQRLGLSVEQYHLHVLGQGTARKPPYYDIACVISGRREMDESGFFSAMRGWASGAHKREDLAYLGDHMLQARGQQHQHNFAPLSFVVWVMPLLGFIGTVIGITQAISGLEEVAAVASRSGGGLADVLVGLRFAFDTTFMGLLLVIPVMVTILPLRATAQKLDMGYHAVLLDRMFAPP